VRKAVQASPRIALRMQALTLRGLTFIFRGGEFDVTDATSSSIRLMRIFACVPMTRITASSDMTKREISGLYAFRAALRN